MSHRCRDCQACALACSLWHEGECNPRLARLSVDKDLATNRVTIGICVHCDEPECFTACPTGAIQLDNLGVASIIDSECVGCGGCATSCPHGAVFYNEPSGRYIKCDLCAGRLEGPLCVEVCPVGALVLENREA